MTESHARVDRLTRINELLRREIGLCLFQIMHESDFDLSAVTITHVATTRDLREARVSVSIRDHHPERHHMLSLLRKHRADIQTHINRVLQIRFTPRLSFHLDPSIERGDQILHLLDTLPEKSPASAPDEPPSPGENPTP